MIEVAERTTIGVIVPRELRARLEQAAASNERSVGAEVRVALHRHLDGAQHEQETNDATSRR